MTKQKKDIYTKLSEALGISRDEIKARLYAYMYGQTTEVLIPNSEISRVQADQLLKEFRKKFPAIESKKVSAKSFKEAQKIICEVE